MKEERLKAVYKTADERFTEKDYMNFLDENEGAVSVLGYSWGAGYVLKELDPIAFQQAYQDELSTMDDVYLCPVCDEEYLEEEDAENCCQGEEENE